MKRLSLRDFKAKTLIKKGKEATDKLLGQVLGDCHDNHSSGGENGGGHNVGEIGASNGFV